MSVDFVNNKLRTALTYAESSAVCLFPCAAVRNVRDTLRTVANSEGSVGSALFVSTYTSAMAGAVVGGVGAIAVSHLLGANLIPSMISGLSSCLLTALTSGTIAHYCIKKRKNHAASPDPKSQNEEMLPETAQEIAIDVENQMIS